MRKSLAGILLALLTTFGVFVAAAAPAGAAPTTPVNKLGSQSPINFPATDASGKKTGVAHFQPDHAALNSTGDGVVLVGDMTYKGVTQTVSVPVLPDTSGSSAPSTRAATPGDASAQQLIPPGPCQVLHLVLGPLSLNVLGLIVNLNQVVLDLSADPNGGLLGSLLCSLSGGPTGGTGGLSGALNQIIGILTGILNGLGGA